MKDIDRTESENENLPANPQQKSFYGEYGDQAAQRNIVGQILKFSKGHYLAGASSDEVEAGTQVIVDMTSLEVGWQKWWSGKPVDSHMGLVLEGYQPPTLKNVGDRDPAEWEKDEDGVARDPWQFTNTVVMRQLGTTGDNDGLFTFSTSSRGGINAIGVLCKEYDKKIRMGDPNLLPIIELNADSYPHSNKRFGVIDVPVFDVVGWGKAADVEDATEATIEKTEDDAAEEKPAPAKKAAAAATKKPAPVKKAAPGKKKARF
ncbi:hypothetical protein ACFIOY_21385 [Bradyrhizobium sp. TZ2]